jgi:hypothetical protein
MSRKTGGSPIGWALKSCTFGVFTNGIDADFFLPFSQVTHIILHPLKKATKRGWLPSIFLVIQNF